jgi:hypothetical protein
VDLVRGHAQFIADTVGIRTLRLVEAARIMGFVPRVVEQLSTVKESLAYHMLVGNAVPVETFGAIIIAMVEMWQAVRTMTESSSAEVVDVEVQIFSADWHGDEALPDLVLVLSLVSWRCLPVTRIWQLLFLHYRNNAS